MKIFNDKNIIEIEKEDIKDAKLSSLDIADQIIRKRAFLNILGGRIAMKYLFSQKLDANNLYSLYTIHNVLKNIDISDIYCNNIHADVRIVFNEEELFIPKSHEENEIYPDVYLIFKLNNSVTSATFLGYIEPKDINKNNENKDYYFVELDELKNPETIKTFLNNFSPEEKQISQEEITQAESFFLTVTDTEISKKSLKVLLHTLLYNYDLREKLVEFENFEFLSKKIATDENLQQDNLLGIVGTQELYQNEENEEQTQQEEKAEIIEEVLSDLIETKELENSSSTDINEESEDFLNELMSEEETTTDTEEKEKTSTNNTGEILKDAGIALAGAAGIVAAGAIAANAAENVVGEIAKDATQGATEALVGGIADIAGSVTDAVASNIKNSTENVLNVDDTLSDIDLDDIEDTLSNNIENITEPVEEIEEIEEIKNSDIEELVANDVEIDNNDIQEVQIEEIENTETELDETTNIDDFESLFEGTSEENDNLDIQEFEIDENSETDDLNIEETFEDVKIEEIEEIENIELDENIETDNNFDIEEINNNVEIEEENDDIEIENITEETLENNEINSEKDIEIEEYSEEPEVADEVEEDVKTKNYETTNENFDNFDNGIQPLGMLDSEDLSIGLMPLDSFEPIGGLGETNNDEAYEYKPSASMLDETFENSISADKTEQEYKPSAPMLEDDEEVYSDENAYMNEEKSSDEEQNTDDEVEDNIDTEIDIEEISNDIDDTSNDELDIVNVEEDNSDIEENIDLSDISIEEVQAEFDPDSPLANTEAEPIFEGITSVEMGLDNDMPDYMKSIQGIDAESSKVTNLDIEDIENVDTSINETSDENLDIDNIMNTENELASDFINETNNETTFDDITDILNETENSINSSDFDLNDEDIMKLSSEENINTENIDLDNIDTSDALISDIDNFLNNINTSDENESSASDFSTQSSNTEENTNEENDTTEATDNTLKVLFKEGRTPEIPNLFPSVTKFVNKIKTDKKMMIAASLACVVATSLVIGAITPKNNNNVDLNNAQEMVNNQSPNADGQDDVLTEQDAQNLGMDTQYQNESIEQQSSLAENTQMDSGQVMSNAFSSEPVNTNITKVAWEVSEDLAYNDAFRKYLQMAGKNLKINIQNELLLLNELAYSDSIIVDLSLDQTGNLKNVTIQKSSGSKKIDKLILQCVKDTMKYLKVPTDEIRKSGADATLIINF